MSIWTSIANSALMRLNEKRVVSINDTTALAQRIRDLKDGIAREVLEDHPWNSAAKHQVLTQTSVSGVDWKAFDLPSDMVRPLRVFSAQVDPDDPAVTNWSDIPLEDWRAEGDRLIVGERLLSAEGVGLVFVAYDEAEMGRWSPSLQNAVACLLAARLAVGTTGGVKLAEAKEAEYYRALAKAQRLDTYREGRYQNRYDNEDAARQVGNYSLLTGSS